MIRHIVMWTLKPEAEGATRAENARRMKAQLESLRGRVPGMRSLEVGIALHVVGSAKGGPDDADVVLVSEHDDQAALDAYQSHPEHVAMKAFIGAVRERRVALDYLAD
jgi:hypothetical protein